MRASPAFALLTLLVLVALPVEPVRAADRDVSLFDFAQSTSGLIRPELGRAYLGFAPDDLPTTDWDRRSQWFAPQVPFHFFVIAHIDPSAAAAQGLNSANGIYAWELSVTVPAELIVMSRTLAPTGSLDVAGGDDNWVVGTGGACLTIDHAPHALLDYQALLLQPAQDLTVDVSHSEPSSFYRCPGGQCSGRKVAGWLECGAAGDLHPFEAWYEHYASILINPSSGPGPQYEADPEQSTATSAAGTLLICPDGAGQTLAQKGLTIQVEVRSRAGTPLAGVPAGDLWLDSPTAGGAFLCMPGNAADAATDVLGRTTFSGEVFGGGCTSAGFTVMLLGLPLSGGPAAGPDVLPIATRSPDITGDGAINLADCGRFSSALHASHGDCADFDGDGIVSLPDVGIFSAHLGHSCGR